MSATLVRDIMPRKMVTISESDRLSTVEDIMTLGRVRHMPVVHGGKLVGVVSERDLLRSSLSSLSEFGTEERRAFLHVVEIGRVMSAPAITIGPRNTVEEAARVMAEKKIGCLPVVDEDDILLGLITETDVLRYFAGLAPIDDA
ncbi:MAG: CBS domain-containing protein [Myxococcota bacterium]